MKSFNLKFERYVQEAAWVKVKAKSLADAIAKAAEADRNNLDWEEECLVEGDRLFGVIEGRIESGNWVAQVELNHLFGVPTWFSEDLIAQCGDTEFQARKERAKQFAKAESDEWELARGRCRAGVESSTEQSP